MAVGISEGLVHLAQTMRLRELGISLGRAAILPGVLFLLIYLLEVWLGKDKTRYRSRHFANDMAYFLFFGGGFYSIFFGAAIVNALGPRLSIFKVGVLEGLPLPLHFLIYWIVLDFVDYWIHRAKHSWKFLWSFHAIHHAQEQMTFGTSWRFHPVEQMLVTSVMIVPLYLLGAPTGMWIPLIAAQYALEAVQHSQLDWRYGKLYPIFVSPVFHAIHHSTDRAHYDTNFAKIFSWWDYLFGTAVDAPRPLKTGISGPPIRESLPYHMVVPFIAMFRPNDPHQAPAPTPAPPPAIERSTSIP